MRRLLSIALLAAGLAVPSGAVLAQEANYDAADVVDFFVKDQEQLGAARGICVGTAEECNAEAKPSAQPANAWAKADRIGAATFYL